MNKMLSEQVKNLIPILRDCFKQQPIEKAWLFGSCSRGEENEQSDVDILVQYDRRNARVGLFTIVQIQLQLKNLLGREVDLVEDGTLMPFAIDSANRDKVLIYERAS